MLLRSSALERRRRRRRDLEDRAFLVRLCRVQIFSLQRLPVDEMCEERYLKGKYRCFVTANTECHLDRVLVELVALGLGICTARSEIYVLLQAFLVAFLWCEGIKRKETFKRAYG